jgi:hypothetical protein
MSPDKYLALFSTLISFAGLLLVILQLRIGNRQRESDSLVKIFDINRQLLTLGFTHPQLFGVLEGKDADPVLERYYLQLWLNQLSLIHSFLQRSIVEPELTDWLELEIADFLASPNVQRHWHLKRAFYPESFQSFVDKLCRVRTDAASGHPSHGSGVKGA